MHASTPPHTCITKPHAPNVQAHITCTTRDRVDYLFNANHSRPKNQHLPQNRYLGWSGPVPGGDLDAAGLPPGVQVELEVGGCGFYPLLADRTACHSLPVGRQHGRCKPTVHTWGQWVVGAGLAGLDSDVGIGQGAATGAARGAGWDTPGAWGVDRSVCCFSTRATGGAGAGWRGFSLTVWPCLHLTAPCPAVHSLPAFQGPLTTPPTRSPCCPSSPPSTCLHYMFLHGRMLPSCPGIASHAPPCC